MEKTRKAAGFRLQVIMAVAALSVLPACGAEPYNRVNLVAATQVEHSVQFERNDTALSVREENLLREFLSGLPPLATEEIVMEGRLEGNKYSEERLYNLRRALLAQRFPREAIAIVHSPEMQEGVIQLTVTTGRVVPPADCPDWSDWSGNNFNNYTYSNYGCANTYNLGQQVAHPYDLVHGTEGDDAPDGERNSAAIVPWRSNTPNATETSGSGSQDAGFSGSGESGSGGGEGQ